LASASFFGVNWRTCRWVSSNGVYGLGKHHAGAGNHRRMRTFLTARRLIEAVGAGEIATGDCEVSCWHDGLLWLGSMLAMAEARSDKDLRFFLK